MLDTMVVDGIEMVVTPHENCGYQLMEVNTKQSAKLGIEQFTGKAYGFVSVHQVVRAGQYTSEFVKVLERHRAQVILD